MGTPPCERQHSRPSTHVDQSLLWLGSTPCRCTCSRCSSSTGPCNQQGVATDDTSHPPMVSCIAASRHLSLPQSCQLPTFIHLGGSRSHNALHGRKVIEMLKPPPQDFRAGVIPATTSDKTAQLGNPLDDLRKRGRLGRWLRDAMDGTIEGRPFFWVQQDA